VIRLLDLADPEQRAQASALRAAAAAPPEVAPAVARLIDEVRTRGDAAVRELSRKFDGWHRDDYRLTDAEIRDCLSQLSARDIEDIKFAQAQVKNFAEHQRAALQDVEVETLPGVVLGHKNIPVQSVGCYVPGGKYPLLASAHMSVITAKVAGVPRIVTAAPPFEGRPAPAIVAAQHLAGADTIYCLGGIQAVGAMALGTQTIEAVDMLVGPGNAYVAEAKRQLYGRVGIDLFAGPTEILVIADETADPDLVAQDLVGQAEHGPDSPAWLVTTSESLGRSVLASVPRLIAALPPVQRQAAEAAWRDYGEVVLCDSDEEAACVADDHAPEHLEIHTGRDGWYANRLRNYGSLFIGEETTVAFGDKCAGPNHILPTKGAGHYTGGLSVHKFLKIVTTQRMTREACREVAAVAARISRLEGMEAHARTGDARLRKYSPGENSAPPT
jgi:sulfopropanediol 3-dehydrogenase